jgi:hypothetical protein
VDEEKKEKIKRRNLKLNQGQFYSTKSHDLQK